MKKMTETKKLWRYFIACLIIGFGITIPLELSLAFIYTRVSGEEMTIPNLLWIIFVSIIVGALVMAGISKRLITPLTKLSAAMNRVAEGDFETQIETTSKIEAIQDIYTNFNLMVKEIKATETLQTDFVSNVSHEFKTPINAIEGYTTLLQSTDNIDETENQYIEKILFNTRRLSSLVSNILILSKIENQNIQTNKTKFRLDEQIREAIVTLEQGWTDKNIGLNVELDEIEYYGTEALMYHIWSNIIGNAVKFTAQDSTIKISLTEESGSYVFCVDDEGPGISEEAHKHIFDKFYQADSSHKQEGNGLGLALVKRIVTILGGEITAENLDKGCRFTVVLPKTE